MNYDELSSWCLQHREIPEDTNNPFICSYQINIDGDDPENFPEECSSINNPDKSFRLFITTRHLICLASEIKTIQADATYKLLWHNFPVLIIGFSDMDKVFHPLGLALCTTERGADFEFIFNSLQVGLYRCGHEKLKNISLVADAADSITNGFANVFFPENEKYKRGTFLLANTIKLY